MASTTSTAHPINTGSIISATSYFAGASAITGAVFGAGYATLKQRPVVLWTVATGGQWGVLGGSFWFTRSILRQHAQREHGSQALPLREELAYSTVAGSFSGLIGGAFRGRSNILPGAIFLGLVGLGGQLGYHGLSLMDTEGRDRRPILDRLSDSKWWPLKSLSDEEYEHDLTEQLIAIEAEVSIIDEKLSALRLATRSNAK